MTTELEPLIEQVRTDTHSHVVVFLSEAGVHWRCESKEACDCIAEIIGNSRVMPRQEFIESLESIEAGGQG